MKRLFIKRLSMKRFSIKGLSIKNLGMGRPYMKGVSCLAACCLLLLAACSQEADRSGKAAGSNRVASTADVACANASEYRMALFGDVHVHTSFSFDASANSTGATPEDAHRYAKGREIPFFPVSDEGQPLGRTRIDRPLDFLAVTDHGEFLGERALCRTEGSPVWDGDFCTRYRSDQRLGMSMLGAVITTEDPKRIADICDEDGSRCREFARSPWQKIQDAANDAYQPCEFTSFIGYEYTGTPGTSNYHRNVIFRNDQVPDLPVSYIDAPIDSKLWAKLDAVCDPDAGCDYLTIPHNTNLANGRMAPYMNLPQTTAAKRAYAEARLRREPILEIFQHKGGSECVNGLASVLGAPDELCDIENVRPLGGIKRYATRSEDGTRLVIGGGRQRITECAEGEIDQNGMLGAGCVHATDYQRSALAVGLREEARIGLNPIKLGVIAATDTHAATPGNVAESGWTGAVTGEVTPAERLQPGLLTSGIDGNPGGLAGVWATQNTRDAIFDAMQRREVFGTSGPRISLRLFASFNYDENLCEAGDMLKIAYQEGVPMGGDLKPGDSRQGDRKAQRNPRFLAFAAKDPRGQDLKEMHLIKGWVDERGRLHTQVIQVAQARRGAPQLCTVYEDKQFDPARPSYYYLRAVEPETPRWHTFDCKRLARKDRPDVCTDGTMPDMIREMAWSSPVWYKPRR